MSEKKIGGVVEVGAGQVSRWMAEGTALVIDVRETTEYAPAHIPGAVLNPTSRFDVSAVPDPGNRSLVFSCAAGVRSQRAAERYVKEHPEATVYNLTGGFNAWSAGGHESVVNQVASDDLQGLAYTSIGLFFLVTFIVTWR